MAFKIDDKWIAEHRTVYPEEFSRMSYQERLDLYNNNREQYDSLVSSEKMKHQTHNHSEALQAMSNKVQKTMIIRKG